MSQNTADSAYRRLLKTIEERGASFSLKKGESFPLEKGKPTLGKGGLAHIKWDCLALEV